MTPGGLPAFGTRTPPLDPHSLAREILLRGGFHLRAQTEQISWWERFLNWAGALISKYFPHIAGPSPGLLQFFGFALLFVAIGLVVAVLVRLLLSLSPDSAVSANSVRALQSRTAAKVWYERAVAAAQENRLREAIVLLFRAALAILDLRGFVRDEPSRTVEECASELAQRAPAQLVSFRTVARAFTAAAYAERPVAQADWERARAAYEHIFTSVTNAS